MKKNTSKKIPVGTTLQTRDEYLASGAGKKNIKPDHPNPRDLYRRVGVVDSNSKDELGIIKLGTKGRHALEDYLSGQSKYNAYIEIYDNKGNRIKIDNVKFVKNSEARNISKKDVNAMKKMALVSKKTSKSLRKSNRKTLRELKGRK